jgi:hypothetical protein
MGIHTAGIVEDSEGAEGKSGAFAAKGGTEIIPRVSVPKGDGVDQDVRIGCLTKVEMREAASGLSTFFQIIIFCVCTFLYEHLHNLGGEETMAVVTFIMATDEQASFGACFQDDEDTAVGEQVNPAAGNVDELNRTVEPCMSGKVKHETVLDEEGVEGDDTIVVGGSSLAVIAFGKGGVSQAEIVQATGKNALGQLGRIGRAKESIVDEKERGEAEVGDIATKRTIGIEAAGAGAEVQAIVVGEEGLGVSIPPVRIIGCREALFRQGTPSWEATFVHGFGAMSADLGFVVGEEGEILLVGVHGIRACP